MIFGHINFIIFSFVSEIWFQDTVTHRFLLSELEKYYLKVKFSVSHSIWWLYYDHPLGQHTFGHITIFLIYGIFIVMKNLFTLTLITLGGAYFKINFHKKQVVLKMAVFPHCSLVLLAWKGVRRVANFLLQFFVPLFSYTIFKQLFNISAAQNKNYFK